MTAYIGYNNLIPDATITVTSEAAGYEKEYAFNWLTSDWWQGTSAATQNYDIDLGSAQSVDYFGLAGHNLPDNSGTVALQHSTTGAFAGEEVTAISAITPTDNAPIFRTFTSVSRRYWRFVFTATGSASYVGALSLGEVLALPNGIPKGFIPPPHNRAHLVYNSVTQGGNFAGRSVKRRGWKADIMQKNVAPSWVETNWPALADHLETKPFFFCWDYENEPDHSVLAWVAKKLDAPKYSHELFMSFSIKCEALHGV